MGCTAGCLNITIDDEKHIDLFAETFIEVMNDELYDPLEKEDIVSFFDTDGDITFTLDAEPIFSYGHGYENVIDFLKAFIKKAPDVELDGDFYSDWNNCCDICILQFEYKDCKLSLMSLFSEVFGVECKECGEEIEMSDIEMDFDNERCPVCPECGAKILDETSEDDEEGYFVNVDDLILEDGEWIEPEDFLHTTEGDHYLTGVAPDEVTNAWKYEDFLAAMGVLPELPKGTESWSGLPRVHAAAEQGDEKAIEILAALKSYEAAFAENVSKDDNDEEVSDEEAEKEPESNDEAEEADEELLPPQAESEELEEMGAKEEASEGEEQEAVKAKWRKWWVIPLAAALIAAGAAAVQFSGLYDIAELFGKLFG